MRSIIKVRNTTHKGGHKMRDWLLKLRIKNKMTQEEVAIKAEISRTTYASIEQGRRRPSVESAMRIASILDFDWTIFFE